jgi:hypothetical protein
VTTVDAVGSGLILLVIVGAWLAVLVPMALKSHESAASLTSVDRFNDAMRVLSRREERYAARRAVVMPARPAEVLEPVGLTAAERRRRTLAVLIGTALVSLGLALMSVPVMMPLHVVCDLLLVGFVVHLRRQAVLRAERRARQRPVVPAQRRVAHEEPVAVPVRIAGIPERMPRRPEPLTASLPAPAARYDEATVVADNSWEPVPVPPPTYVGKAAAPARPPRVLDLTKPGEWSASFEDDDTDLIEVAELDDILDRRRAANGW